MTRPRQYGFPFTPAQAAELKNATPAQVREFIARQRAGAAGGGAAPGAPGGARSRSPSPAGKGGDAAPRGLPRPASDRPGGPAPRGLPGTEDDQPGSSQAPRELPWGSRPGSPQPGPSGGASGGQQGTQQPAEYQYYTGQVISMSQGQNGAALVRLTTLGPNARAQEAQVPNPRDRVGIDSILYVHPQTHAGRIQVGSIIEFERVSLRKANVPSPIEGRPDQAYHVIPNIGRILQNNN